MNIIFCLSEFFLANHKDSVKIYANEQCTEDKSGLKYLTVKIYIIYQILTESNQLIGFANQVTDFYIIHIFSTVF